jgi:hypothetical protein
MLRERERVLAVLGMVTVECTCNAARALIVFQIPDLYDFRVASRLSNGIGYHIIEFTSPGHRLSWLSCSPLLQATSALEIRPCLNLKGKGGLGMHMV